MKTRDYLLSTDHPRGRHKATFFLALGYSRDEWTRLADDLRTLACSSEARATALNTHGQKFEVRGILRGPNGRLGSVVTVWIVLGTDGIPRLVTAVPGLRT